MKFHHLSWIVTIVVGVQMVLAGIIVGESAGFVCPNWPVCGTANGTMSIGSLIFELTHRFVAAALGILVVWLFVWLLVSYRHHRAMVWTCILGLLSLFIQIVYAGLIVLLVLPGIATVVDVLNSMIMLSLFVHLSNLAQREFRQRKGMLTDTADIETQSLRPFAWILYLVGMLTVAAGAVFRHTGASQALFGQDSYLLSHNQHNPPSQIVSQTLLFSHIATAVLLVAAGLLFVVMAFQRGQLKRAASFIIALIFIQGILGVASLATRLQLTVVTMHWAMAGLIMGVITFVLSQTYLARVPVENKKNILTDGKHSITL